MSIITATLVGGAVLSGCSGGSAAPSPSTGRATTSGGLSFAAPQPDASAGGTASLPVPGSVEASAVAATRSWLSYDTRVDHRPNDTAKRLALPWLAPALRQQVVGFSSTTDPGADWATWTAHHAHAGVEVQVGGDDHPADTASTASRQVRATVSLQGDAGWTASLQRTVFVQLTSIDGAWLVSDLRVSES